MEPLPRDARHPVSIVVILPPMGSVMWVMFVARVAVLPQVVPAVATTFVAHLLSVVIVTRVATTQQSNSVVIRLVHISQTTKLAVILLLLTEMHEVPFALEEMVNVVSRNMETLVLTRKTPLVAPLFFMLPSMCPLRLQAWLVVVTGPLIIFAIQVKCVVQIF